MVTLECQSCQKPFQVEGEGEFVCPYCETINEHSATTKDLSAWEKGYKKTPLATFIATVKAVLGSPNQFFKSIKVSDNYLPVGLFGVLTQSIGALFVVAYQALFGFFKPILSSLFTGVPTPGDFFSALATPFLGVFMIILAPLFALVTMVFMTALYHFILWILQGSQKGVEATAHAVGYSQAAHIINLVPFVGSMVAGIWQMILIVIGLKHLHGISYLKSILTVLIPFLVCCCGAVLFFGAVSAMLYPAMLDL